MKSCSSFIISTGFVALFVFPSCGSETPTDSALDSPLESYFSNSKSESSNSSKKPPLVPGCPDLNADGLVNVQDVVLAGQRMGQCGSDYEGVHFWRFDLDNDGCVTQKDLDIVTQAFGQNTTCAKLNRCPDLNRDNKIDVLDAVIIDQSFYRCRGEKGYKGKADITRDKCVDNGDSVAFAQVFGADPATIEPCLPR